MKKMIKLVTSCLLATLVFAGTALGQTEETRSRINRRIYFDGDSKKEEINIMINNETEVYFITLESRIKGGKLKAGIYDPNEEDHGEFSLGSINNNDWKETVSGKIEKTFVDPMKGLWKIKLLPNNASGYISIIITKECKSKD